MYEWKEDGFDLDLKEKRLVSFGDDRVPVWISELEKIEARAKGIKFMDITDHPTLGLGNMLSASGNQKKLFEYPSPSAHNSTTHQFVKSLYPSISTDGMKSFLTAFSGNFRTRYYKSSTGADSSKWLLEQVKEVASTYKGEGVTVRHFEHSWGQNSIIARIPAKTKSSKKNTVVVIGAHQDSANMWPFLPAPGADDDGSGTTSTLFAFKALSKAGFVPTDSDLEFHWYSAEEGGLLGSQAIAKEYESQGIVVKAMVQMDMTAWVKGGTEEVIGVITDFVDPGLSKFVDSAVTAYLDIPPVPTQCGYACSDHASFSKAGYQSAFTIESTFADSDKLIHSTGDTMAHPEFSFDHMKEFTKLAIAFGVELAGYDGK